VPAENTEQRREAFARSRDFEYQARRETRLRTIIMSALVLGSAAIIGSAYWIDRSVTQAAFSERTGSVDTPRREASNQDRRAERTCANNPRALRSGDNLSFVKNESYLLRCTVGAGWSEPESNAVWQVERDAQLTLNIESSVSTVYLDLDAFAPGDYRQVAVVTVNGKAQASIEFDRRRQRREVTIEVDPGQKRLLIGFETETLARPIDHGVNMDSRYLGLRLYGVYLE